MSGLQLRLYITGQTPRAMQAIANLQRMCDTLLGDGYELTIVDVLEQPHLAEADQIIATPTLLKLMPPPARRIIGDLSDAEKVLVGLDLHTRGDPFQPPTGSSNDQH